MRSNPNFERLKRKGKLLKNGQFAIARHGVQIMTNTTTCRPKARKGRPEAYRKIVSFIYN